MLQLYLSKNILVTLSTLYIFSTYYNDKFSQY